MNIKQVLHHLNRRDTPLLPKNSMLTKCIVALLVISTAFFFVKSTTAQTNNSAALEFGKSLKAEQDSVSSKKPSLGSWSQNAMNYNALILFGAATGGGFPINEDGSVKTTGYIPGGILGTTTNMISSLYNQPISGVEYIAQAKDNFFGKSVYAQNTGFNSLQPLLPLWKVLRNTVYSIISIFFIAIGIMIMLRVKINPQTVVNIQNSIPKIITTMILVTFSYAIAGLMIDLTKVVHMLVLSFFFSAKGTSFGNDLFPPQLSTGGDIGITTATTTAGNFISWIINSIGSALGIHLSNMSVLSNMTAYNIYTLANSAIPSGYGVMLGEIVGQVFIGTILGGVGGAVLGSFGSNVAGGVGAVAGDVVGGLLGTILVPLIMSIAITVWLVKLYFGMLKSYISAIFKIITGPIQIGFGAFPGSKMNFSSWFIDLLADLLVFPGVCVFIVFIKYLSELVVGKNLWMPSAIYIATSQTITGNVANLVAAGIGIAGLAMLPKLPQLIPEAIFQLKPSPYGKALGESLGGINNFAGKPIKGGAKYGVSRGGEYLERLGYETLDDGKTPDYMNPKPGTAGIAGRAGRAIGFFTKRK